MQYFNKFVILVFIYYNMVNMLISIKYSMNLSVQIMI